MFSVNTVLGYVIIVYDTINNCYTSIDQDQIGDNAVKQFAQINIDFVQLFCITSDDKVYQLLGSADTEQATIRLGAVSTQDPKKEIKVGTVRAIFTNITEDIEVTCSVFTNNRLDEELTTKIKYTAPTTPYTGAVIGDDLESQTTSLMFSFTRTSQGWKSFVVLTWTGNASLTSVGVYTDEKQPMQPPLTQAVVKQT
jgi:hypothetical protein